MQCSIVTSRLTVDCAARSFGDRAALDGVSLALEAGEIYALLGPNGAGKTTLVRAICGRARLDRGTIRVLGENPASSASARRSLGLVPQEIALYEDLTARENLELFGRLAGLRPAASRVAAAQALDWIGLADRAQHRVGVLSGGMKRRVNLAAGVLHDPAVLLLDEPTAGVDPQARERVHDLLRDLAKRGIAILLTTHDLDQAAELASRIGILDEGRLLAEGTLRELIARSFGTRRELEVALSAPPPAEGLAALAALGLAAVDEAGLRFSGGAEGGFDELSELTRRAAAAGSTIVEISLREPSLRGVFFRLTGKELRE